MYCISKLCGKGGGQICGPNHMHTDAEGRCGTMQHSDHFLLYDNLLEVSSSFIPFSIFEACSSIYMASCIVQLSSCMHRLLTYIYM